MRIVYITAPSAGEAKKISHALLHKKLVACTNIFPIESMYWWDGEIEEQVEFVILAKAPDEKFEEIESAVKKIHSYGTPAIYSWKVDKVNESYAAWIDKETK
jgi:periplasmic divalent cation tolerance protein